MSEHKMGSMDISQHKAAYNGFMKMTVWVAASPLPPWC